MTTMVELAVGQQIDVPMDWKALSKKKAADPLDGAAMQEQVHHPDSGLRKTGYQRNSRGQDTFHEFTYGSCGATAYPVRPVLPERPSEGADYYTWTAYNALLGKSAVGKAASYNAATLAIVEKCREWLGE